jgi:hypothetical protein
VNVMVAFNMTGTCLVVDSCVCGAIATYLSFVWINDPLAVAVVYTAEVFFCHGGDEELS